MVIIMIMIIIITVIIIFYKGLTKNSEIGNSCEMPG